MLASLIAGAALAAPMVAAQSFGAGGEPLPLPLSSLCTLLSLSSLYLAFPAKLVPCFLSLRYWSFYWSVIQQAALAVAVIGL